MKALKHKTKRNINGFIFILPWLIGFITFFAIPIINTCIYSFNTVSVASTGGMNLDFSGIKNYIDLFKKEVTTENTQILRMLLQENQKMLVDVPLTVIFSLFIALLINAKFKGRGLARVVFFLPIILGLDIVVKMMKIDTSGVTETAATVFDSTSFSDVLLQFTGLKPEVVNLIQNTINGIFTLITRSGVQTLIFLAGLQSINPSLYEVAKIEGVTTYETFWKVTIPLTSNIIFFVAVYTLVDMFLASPITKEIHNFAFVKSKIGVGSALSMIFILNAVVLLGAIVVFLKKVVKLDYDN